MLFGIRLQGWWDDLRDSLWLVPAVTILAALLLAVALVAVEPLPGWIPEEILFKGTPDGAREVLGQLASAIITVVGLVFSLTVVALQMAASQYTPRLLRTFLRDRRVQAVLSGMLGAAVYSVAIMQTVRTTGEGVSAFVPRLAVSVALLLSLTAVGLLVFFVHHVTQHLRPDVIMNEITAQTLQQLAARTPDRDALPDQQGSEPPDHAAAVLARKGGYLQLVDHGRLARAAADVDVRIRLRPTAGNWVTKGTTLAWVWADPGGRGPGDREELAALVHQHVHLGPDRTESADLAFGLRQLQDITSRALSTGMNDPTTAVLAISQMAAILCRFAAHPLGAMTVLDDDGLPRAIVPQPTFEALLELAVGGARRFGSADPDVLAAVLSLLTDVAEHVADSADRGAMVRAQIGRTMRSADLPDPVDRGRIERLAQIATSALTHGIRTPSVTDAS